MWHKKFCDTAALIIPNNSFLQGDLSVGHFQTKIASSLKYNGYDLKKISVVNENDRSVAHELTYFSKLYDIVVVLTIAPGCVSQALANISFQELYQQTELTKYGSTKENYFMWPKSTKLLKSKSDVYYPVIYFQRIFILLQGIFDDQLTFILNDHLQHYREKNVYTKIYSVPSNGHKNLINSIQNESMSITVEKHSNDKSSDKSEKNILKLTSDSFESMVNTEKIIRGQLGLNILNSSWVNSVYDKLYESLDKHLQVSIEVIEKCLGKYGVENVFLSFNGGKDCTVLLHLMLSVLEKKYSKQKSTTKFYCLYVRSENAFREQDEFIDQCRIFYNLEVVTVTSNIKDALRLMLDQHPHFKACFMGTRRTDPFSINLNIFEMTDPEWPQVMRCSPLLDWYYSDIWDYLLYYKVPYCKLYDFGYTSLGNATNTIRNPSLRFNDGDKEIYLPAYKLLNEQHERIGRNISKI